MFTSRKVDTRPLRGFTLVELLTTMAVAAILLAIATPGLGRMLQSFRLNQAANELVAAANLARVEAVQRGSRVTLVPCRWNEGTGLCTTGSRWRDGWALIAGPAEGSTDLTVTRANMVRLFSPLAADLTISNIAPGYLSYARDGRALTWAGFPQNQTITLRAGEKSREVIINRLGRVRVQQGGG